MIVRRKHVRDALWFLGVVLMLHGWHIHDDKIHHFDEELIAQRVFLVGAFLVIASAHVWGLRTCRCGKCHVEVSQYDKVCWNCEARFNNKRQKEGED